MGDLANYATQTLKDVGITKGQTVLDCCCGCGIYTIPAAKLVGNKGKIFAVDRNGIKLDDLKEKVKAEKLQNVEIMEQDVEAGISIPEKVDIILLYDVFWYFGAKETKTTHLLEELNKIGKKNVLISVYPTHTYPNDVEYFKKLMNEMGFVLESEYSRKVVHEKHIEEGKLLNFRKMDP